MRLFLLPPQHQYSKLFSQSKFARMDNGSAPNVRPRSSHPNAYHSLCAIIAANSTELVVGPLKSIPLALLRVCSLSREEY